jgi:hypothetical protein
MKRKVLLTFALLASVLVSQSMALTPGRVTMLVVPARYSVMQVAFDLAQKYSIVLVSYQGDASSEAPLLHAWNGKEWAKITADEYANASFLQVTPGEALLIGDEKLLPPVLASSISGWCPKVTTIPSIDTATLVNTFAKEFSFKPGEWEWFARRYNLTLNDENAPRRSASWYDRPAYEDKYSPKVDRWLGKRKPAAVLPETVEPVTAVPEVVPQAEAPAEAPVQTEPVPAPVADAAVNAPPPAAEAAFTASPMPEEEARKALQAPPPVVEDTAVNPPAALEPSAPVAVPSSEVPQPQPADAGTAVP